MKLKNFTESANFRVSSSSKVKFVYICTIFEKHIISFQYNQHKLDVKYLYNKN